MLLQNQATGARLVSIRTFIASTTSLPMPAHKTQTHRHTDTQTHRDTETQRHRDTPTHRHTDTQTRTHTERERETELSIVVNATIPGTATVCSTSTESTSTPQSPCLHQVELAFAPSPLLFQQFLLGPRICQNFSRTTTSSGSKVDNRYEDGDPGTSSL